MALLFRELLVMCICRIDVVCHELNSLKLGAKLTKCFRIMLFLALKLEKNVGNVREKVYLCSKFYKSF